VLEIKRPTNFFAGYPQAFAITVRFLETSQIDLAKVDSRARVDCLQWLSIDDRKHSAPGLVAAQNLIETLLQYRDVERSSTVDCDGFIEKVGTGRKPGSQLSLPPDMQLPGGKRCRTVVGKPCKKRWFRRA
jgi:hypothetical protein